MLSKGLIFSGFHFPLEHLAFLDFLRGTEELCRRKTHFVMNFFKKGFLVNLMKPCLVPGVTFKCLEIDWVTAIALISVPEEKTPRILLFISSHVFLTDK